jgi:LPXTG-motif cell wall-anchored protein
VPSVCRRIVVLLVVALLGVGGGPIAAAHAQGAGDQQYQDPFGGDDSGSSGDSGSGNSDSGSSNGSGEDITPLSPSPQTSGGSTGSTGSSGTSSGTGAATPATTTPATSGTLPNTGLDTRVLLLAGAVLVLLGAGLRMRNAPERF